MNATPTGYRPVSLTIGLHAVYDPGTFAGDARLVPGEALEVLAVPPGQTVLVRRLADGQELAVNHWFLQRGMEYQFHGRWYPDTHPVSVAYIQHALTKALAREVPQAMKVEHQETIEGYRDALRRAGRPVE